MKRLLIFLSIIFITQSTFAEFMCDDANQYRAIYEINSYTCQSGEFLPANTLGCQSCPTGMSCGGGTFDFNPDNFQGLNFNGFPTTTLNNICADNFYDYSVAVYVPNQYTCNAGYYMPANTDGCTICPTDSYCVGGTYTFNETLTQGIIACPVGKISDAGSDDVSDCHDPAINCSAGYYLPANANACSICPGDSYCVGGTYNLETNVPQGIVSCASGLFAPAGMWESAQCGRILHVGDGFVYLRATKKTSPSLHLDLDHDGVADYFGNMTTLDVPMSRDTQRKLKVRYNNTTYSIYDDSVELSLYE